MANKEKCNRCVMKDRRLQEIKEGSFFRKFVCNSYNEMNNTNNNPVELSDKIDVKLKQNINNVKTQLLVSRMDQSNINDVGTEFNKEQKKMMTRKKMHPSRFLSLFVMKGVIDNYGKEKD